MLSCAEGLAWQHVGIARPSVSNRVTLTDGRGEGQPSTPSQGVGDLPPANGVVHRPAGVAHEPSPFANGQFVHRISYEDVITIEIIRSVDKLPIHRIVAPETIGAVI